jgi:beta-mannosidase
VAIFGINETELSVTGELRYGVFNLAGDYPLDYQLPVTIPANTSREIAGFSRDQWERTDRSMAFAALTQEGRVIARNRLCEPFFRDLHWPVANVRCTVKGGVARFESESYAWGICLDLDGAEALADNFFDLYPGMVHEIAWPRSTPPVIRRIGNLT